MTWRFSNLSGYSVAAHDGLVGTVNDFLFADDTWQLKWLVVDTGTWLPGRQVLVPASTLGTIDKATVSISVGLPMERIKNSPGLDFDQPVSRQAEATMFGYYGLDPFVGAGLYPVSNSIAVPFDVQLVPPSQRETTLEAEDPHLRSMAAIKGYQCHATDGDFGFVSDVLIDMYRSRISDFVIDTGTWWPNTQLIVAPQSITQIRWRDSHIELKLDRATLKQSRPFDNNTFVDGVDSLQVVE